MTRGTMIHLGFIQGWQLSLVIISFAPIIFTTTAVLFKVVTKMTVIELKAYGKAGIVAEEVISSIRTVLAYNGQEKEIHRHSSACLEQDSHALWTHLELKSCKRMNKKVRLGYGILSLGHASPFFQALYKARVAAYGIWQIIDQVDVFSCFLSQPSETNTDFDKGPTKYDDLMGDIQFSNVYFFYPARSNVPILTNLSLNIKYGQTIALVGSSGSGKSTCVQLLQRFYNPQLATDGQIQQAAKMANAHDFIMALPNKYETLVGERGAALSGGQKQRIAIARALLRDPKILLLDEATSALDNESEKIVQKALERASQSSFVDRTTLIIAHRLSTIRRADKIIVMQKGEIVEEGDHESLMKIQGLYFYFVKQQNLRQIEEEESKLEDKDMSKLMFTDQPNDISMDDSYDLLVNDDENKIKKKKKTTLAILRMNKPEWILIVIGCIAASITGAREPAYCIIQTKLAIIFQECDKNVQKRKVLLYVLLYLGFGVISLVLHSVQGYVFARSGEALTKRLRSKSFRAILRQDMAFFDREEHSTGELCTRLATEASAVQGASGVRFVFLPLILFGSFLQMRLTAYYSRKDKHVLENAGKIAMEAIQNIQTVMQLTKESYFYNEYCEIFNTVHRSSITRAHILSILFSITSGSVYFSIAAFISLGTFFVDHGTITFEDMFLFPDYGKVIEAAKDIFELLNQKPSIDNESKTGDEIVCEHFNGQVDFDHVYFNYPNRPESTVLKNFKLHIKSDQKIALVGTSGCGKSTSIQLIERFYDVNSGRLSIKVASVKFNDWASSRFEFWNTMRSCFLSTSADEHVSRQFALSSLDDPSLKAIFYAINVDLALTSSPVGYLSR
ncbi:unnamed protein product [Rotaria magnacalcarata]|uniref:Uncharacterized protein n=1 Tax=Rotaria magnacalcarata TaxID=392030 RepID=A0A819TFM0_9BILA|nr:unnamed protein product [Rotaria magnacalcarata]